MPPLSAVQIIALNIVEAHGVGSASASGFYKLDYCPFCQRKKKAGINPMNGAFKCFVCNHEVRGLEVWQQLASHYAVAIHTPPPIVQKRSVKKTYAWQTDPPLWHSRLTNDHQAVVMAWQTYKPLTEETIMRYQLGFGALPPISLQPHRYTMRCNHRRLVYVNRENDARQAVGFRGRQYECSCFRDKAGDLKWLTVQGCTVWLDGLHDLRLAHGKHIIVCENPIDRYLAMQMMPEIYALAPTAGAGTWRDDWSKAIAAANPKSVLVWFDNDLIGNPNEETKIRQIEDWRQGYRQKTGNEPSPDQLRYHADKAQAPKIVESLRRLHVAADCWKWASKSPIHADLGWYLTQ